MIDVMTIRCFRCKKVVDKARGEYDLARSAYRITVECHGETDACDLTDLFLARADASFVKDLEGVAFAPKVEALPLRPKAITHVQ